MSICKQNQLTIGSNTSQSLKLAKPSFKPTKNFGAAAGINHANFALAFGEICRAAKRNYHFSPVTKCDDRNHVLGPQLAKEMDHIQFNHVHSLAIHRG